MNFHKPNDSQFFSHFNAKFIITKSFKVERLKLIEFQAKYLIIFLTEFLLLTF